MAPTVLSLALAASLLGVQDTLRPGAPHAVTPDPLDPLTSAEILTVREVLAQAGRLTPELRFATVALREPPKNAVLLQRISGSVGRTAEALLFDWASSTPIRAHVDLRRRKIIRWDTLPAQEPPMHVVIRRRIEEVVRKDPRWTAALARRGISDPAIVSLIPALGESAPLQWANGRRVVGAQGFHQEKLPTLNRVRGIRLRVDLTSGSVLELTDTSSARPSPITSPTARPASATTPTAPSAAPFNVKGSEIRWRNWRLRFGVHPRRGLELWDIGWMENGRLRPILYRASVSEAMSAYGDPGFAVWYPRDAGNDGLGNSQENSSVPLADAPAGAVYADAVMPDDFGQPVTAPRAVAIYERDGGVLWRHSRRAARARQLVLTSHSTIDNYDFVFNWILGEDGSIEVEVNLTGLMLVYRMREDAAGSAEHAPSSHLVAPGVFAPSHQHFFSYRLDFDVDGAIPNRVLEMDTRSLRRSRRTNPEGLWFTMEERPLATESEAVRLPDPAANRMWRIVNPDRKNQLGESVGYTVVPGISALPFAASSSRMRRQAGFLNAQLFVTPFRRDEQYAAGEFQNFGWRDEGLVRWTRDDRNLLDTDIVLWYTLGITHIPRPEEYPIMPVARAGFRLIPSGFFGRNPSLDGTPAAGRM
jgi:primary-amine oxidase